MDFLLSNWKTVALLAFLAICAGMVGIKDYQLKQAKAELRQFQMENAKLVIASQMCTDSTVKMEDLEKQASKNAQDARSKDRPYVETKHKDASNLAHLKPPSRVVDDYTASIDLMNSAIRGGV